MNEKIEDVIHWIIGITLYYFVFKFLVIFCNWMAIIVFYLNPIVWIYYIIKFIG